MKRIPLITLIVGILLLIPAIAMQFTAEVNWSAGDFFIAGILLLGTGLVLDFVIRNVKASPLKIGMCIGIMLALVVIWAELAVGIFGTPFAGS
jgi:hypothetical protein